VSLDGTRFMVLQPATEGQEIVVVLNGSPSCARA
jgi:hypothetical protein